MALPQIYQPHPALRPYVRYYWSIDVRAGGTSMLNLQVMADRFPRLVIQCLEGKNALHSAQYDSLYAASLKGITSKPALFQMEPFYSHVAVSFFPHGIKALFGIDGFETVDAVLELHHFFSADTIEKIIDTPKISTRISILNKYLLKRLDAVRTIDKRVTDFLYRCPGGNYRAMLGDYGISERQFERKFLQAVGFTPSFYKRVVRFEKALARLKCNSFRSLSSLAYESGYSDQSHMNRDFRQLAGSTPLLLINGEEMFQESGSLLAE